MNQRHSEGCYLPTSSQSTLIPQRSARDSTICLLWQDSSVSYLIQVLRVQLQLLAMLSVNQTLYPPSPDPLQEIGAITVLIITPITLGMIHA